MVLKLLLLSSFLCSVAWAGLPPTSTKASGDASFATTFQFAFPNTDITHTGTLATFGKTYVPGGGTGKGSFTANALIVGSGTSPLLSLSQGSSGQVLHSNGASLPTWAAVSLSQDVTGVTPTANGGTNFSTLSAPSALVVNVANTFSQASGATANKVLRTDGTTIGFAAVNVSTDTTGVENVVNGGTGKATLTANALLLGNGTNPLNFLSGSVSGDVPTYNGSTWISSSGAVLLQLTAVYTTTNSQTITTGTTKLIDFDTSIEDSHSIVTTGVSWHATIPTGYSGLYLITATVNTSAGAAADIDYLPKLFKNNTFYRAGAETNVKVSSGAANSGVTGTYIVRLADADTVDFRITSNSGANQTTSTTAGMNTIAITRIGN